MWKNNYSESRNYFREIGLKDYKNFDKKQGWYFVDKDIETTIDYLFLHKIKISYWIWDIIPFV